MAVSKADKAADEKVVTMDRRRADRRDEKGEAEATEVKTPRRKKQRRRHIDPTTCERDYSDQEIEFMRAMDDYKRDAGRMFPTCSEVLEVIRALGYYQLSEEQIEQLGLGTQEQTSDEGEASDEEAESLEEALA